MPASEVVVGCASSIPVARPEVQLLYMAASKEGKNQHDFEIAQR